MDLTIGVSAKRCAVALTLIVLLLVAASVGASYLALVSVASPFLVKVRESVIRLVWLDGECNIPSWFSSCLLLTASLLLAFITLAQRQQPADPLAVGSSWRRSLDSSRSTRRPNFTSSPSRPCGTPSIPAASFCIPGSFQRA